MGIDIASASANLNHIPTFDGEQSKWRSWTIRMRACMSMAGLEKIMLGDEICPTEADDAAGFAAWNANNLRVYNCLAIALSDNITSIITEERMGNGAAVWRALRTQFTPSTPMQVEQMRNDLR